MKRIYFDIDNPAFITWLKTHPKDSYNVLIGSDTPVDSSEVVFTKVASEGVDLAKWVVDKIQAGEMELKVNTKIDLPQGVVFE
jgi:hypothetical protein